MDSRQLLEIDPSLKALTNETVSFLRPSDLENLEDGVLLFIQDGKFFRKFKSQWKKEKIHLIVSKKFFEKDPEAILSITKAVFLSPNFDLSLSRISKGFYNEWLEKLDHLPPAVISPSAVVSPKASIGDGVKVGDSCRIHPGAVLMEGAKIGDGSEIFPQVVLYPNVVLGRQVRIHAGAVIASDGFGYRFVDGLHQKVWHMGSAVIGDGVEVGAASCIDGGTFSPTTVGDGTKIDNQVHIGHNCHIGQGVLLCGQVGIGGSVKVGDFCVLGGKAGLGPGVTLGQGCQVAGAAQVTGDWPQNSVIAGHPARRLREWLKGTAYLRKLSLKGPS